MLLNYAVAYFVDFLLVNQKTSDNNYCDYENYFENDRYVNFKKIILVLLYYFWLSLISKS